MDDPEFVEKADPEEVFAALSDDTRIAVLRALWDAEDETLSFSDLREAVGIRDSGQFNYHLGKLVGQFVKQTEEGYELTRAGTRINGAIEAGAYTVEGSLEPIELPAPCPTCDGTRTLYYEDETVTVECGSCPSSAQFGVPPSVLADCDREAVPRVACEYLRVTFQRIADGFCGFCEGHVEPSVAPLASFIPDPADVPDEKLPDDPDEWVERAHDLPFIQYECAHCGATPSAGLRLALLSHPAVVSFYHDHGIDVRELNIWNVTWLHPDQESVRQREPFRGDVTFTVDDEALTLVVDEHLDVVEADRDRNA